MLTIDDLTNICDYDYGNSLSSSEDCLMTDCFDVPSNEDFLQQLSSDLDIPLLLNPEDDELGVLNSLLDKSPEEILSEITSPVPSTKPHISCDLNDLQHLDLSQYSPRDFPNLFSEEVDIKSECLSEEFYNSDSIKSESPTPSQSSDSSRNCEIKEEFLIDTPPISPNNNYSVPVVSNINETIKHLNGAVKNLMVVPNPQGQLNILPQTTKNGVIQNRNVYVIPKSKNGNNKRAHVPEAVPVKPKQQITMASPIIVNGSIPNSGSPKVVVLDQLKPVSMNTVNPIPQITNISNSATCIPVTSVPVIIKNEPILQPGMDPKAFKRQQRMIKNRESANLSRKKKKEYLTSLEKQVQELSVENQQLKQENAELKQRLAGFISGKVISSSLNMLTANKTLTKSIALCICLLIIGVNLDLTRKSLSLKSPLNDLESPDDSDSNSHHGRSLLWAPEPETSPAPNITNSNVLPLPICPMYINQSESVRLALELHRWIGKPYNMSEEFYQASKFETKPKLKPKTRLKQRLRSQGQFEDRDEIIPSVYKWSKKRRIPEQISGNELQVFSPTPEQIYADFFEAINRRDDTFYVVSFSPDHMLLPALHHNKTRRPRMSLIMPSMLPNGSSSNHSNLVPLMQIDCEVVDTRMIYVDYGAIPQHMRTAGNTTQAPMNRSQENYKEKPEKPRHRDRTKTKPYKPYFLQESRTNDNSTLDPKSLN